MSPRLCLRLVGRRLGAWSLLAATLWALLMFRHGGEGSWMGPLRGAFDALQEGALWDAWQGLAPPLGETFLLLALGMVFGHFLTRLRHADEVPDDGHGADDWLGQSGGAAFLFLALWFAVTAGRAPLYSHAVALLAFFFGAELLVFGEGRRSEAAPWIFDDELPGYGAEDRFGDSSRMDSETLNFLRFLARKLKRDRWARRFAQAEEGPTHRPPPRDEPTLEIEDPWAVLGLEEGAEARTVRKAFHELSKKFHPDLSPPGMQREAEQAMKKVNLAYRKIMDGMKPSDAPVES